MIQRYQNTVVSINRPLLSPPISRIGFGNRSNVDQAAKSALVDNAPTTVASNQIDWKSYALPKAGKQPRFGMHDSLFPGDILLGDHPPDLELDTLDKSRKQIWDIVTRPRNGFPNGWLQPEDTTFVVSDFIGLMQATARHGFPARYNHYSWGEEFNKLYQPQKHGLSTIFEIVINTKPSYAYLLDSNPVYAQKLVIGHVFGHTDFFKNNIRFEESNRNIMSVMGDNKRAIAKYSADPLILRKSTGNTTPVEKFIDEFKTIEFLIDMGLSAPPPIHPYGQLSPRPEEKSVNLDMGPDKEKLGVNSLMEDFVVSPEERQKAVDEAIDRREGKIKNIPPQPTRDVLGFLVQHSKALEPWQRDVLSRLREESYYFAPQIQTKIMNEGWATWWHTRLGQEGIYEPDELHLAAKMMAGGEAHNPESMNPYLLGRAVMHNIYEKAGRGIPIDLSEDDLRERYSVDELEALKKKPIDDVAGIKAIKHVRRYEDDMSFLRKYFTRDVAKQLDMHSFEEVQDWRGKSEKVITSKDFQTIKARLLQQYDNGGMPIIEVVNGDFKGKGELLMRHQHFDIDLNRKDAQATLKSVYGMWGMPVHLDSFYTVPPDPNKANAIVQAIKQAKETGQPAWFGGESKTLEEMEAELEKLTLNKKKVPIRFSTYNGRDVDLKVLNDDGTVGKTFDPKDYKEKADEDWEWD